MLPPSWRRPARRSSPSNSLRDTALCRAVGSSPGLRSRYPLASLRGRHLARRPGFLPGARPWRVSSPVRAAARRRIRRPHTGADRGLAGLRRFARGLHRGRRVRRGRIRYRGGCPSFGHDNSRDGAEPSRPARRAAEDGGPPNRCRAARMLGRCAYQPSPVRRVPECGGNQPPVALSCSRDRSTGGRSARRGRTRRAARFRPSRYRLRIRHRGTGAAPGSQTTGCRDFRCLEPISWLSVTAAPAIFVFVAGVFDCRPSGPSYLAVRPT